MVEEESWLDVSWAHGQKINADKNGAGNSLRKGAPDAFQQAEGKEETMALEQRLKALRERDWDDLEQRLSELDTIYQAIPAKIQQLVELSGMTEEAVVSCCVSAARHYHTLKWYGILDVLRSFFLAKKQWDDKQKEVAQ